VAKAGLEMWAMCMAEEGVNENISAISIAPGIVDTDMQKDIRNADEISFPSLPNFIEYHKNGELTNPDDVAKTLLPFCLGNSGETGQRLDVRNL
jgi:benzil reductase ((S)-benzoin forming)